MAGGVYVKASNPDSPLWQPGTTLLLAPPSDGGDSDTFEADLGDLSLVTVKSSGRGAKGRLAVTFHEVSDRSDAEQLNRWRLATDRELLLPPEDPDEFWLVEMPGWTVTRIDGGTVGVVVGTLQTHIDLLEVRPAKGGETFYLPMVKDAVAQLDRERRAVVIHDVEGLIPGDDTP